VPAVEVPAVGVPATPGVPAVAAVPPEASVPPIMSIISSVVSVSFAHPNAKSDSAKLLKRIDLNISDSPSSLEV
jgi:hypothetical protein